MPSRGRRTHRFGDHGLSMIAESRSAV